jgi:DsbC/DsbD-like thiol-disulfide interchange protein
MGSMRLVLAMLSCALVACGAATAPAPERGAHPVEARLVADTTAIRPGQMFTVGVELKMKPGWHVYWKNPGDAGLPVSAELSGPEGFRFGQVQWPVPIEFVQPGDVVGYGYDESVLFPITVTAPERPVAGGTVRIAARLSWLVCKDVCIPGKAEVSLDLAVGDAAPANADLFARWRERLPADAGTATVTGRIDPATRRGAYTIRVDWKSPPARVQLFPEADAAVAVGRPSVATDGLRSRIDFEVQIYEGQRPASDRLPALVAFTDAGGARRALTVSIPLQ